MCFLVLSIAFLLVSLCIAQLARPAKLLAALWALSSVLLCCFFSLNKRNYCYSWSKCCQYGNSTMSFQQSVWGEMMWSMILHTQKNTTSNLMFKLATGVCRHCYFVKKGCFEYLGTAEKGCLTSVTSVIKMKHCSQYGFPYMEQFLSKSLQLEMACCSNTLSLLQASPLHCFFQRHYCVSKSLLPFVLPHV